LDWMDGSQRAAKLPPDQLLADKQPVVAFGDLCHRRRHGRREKYTATRAALDGHWVNVLVTDLKIARRFVDEPTAI